MRREERREAIEKEGERGDREGEVRERGGGVIERGGESEGERDRGSEREGERAQRIVVQLTGNRISGGVNYSSSMRCGSRSAEGKIFTSHFHLPLRV